MKTPEQQIADYLRTREGLHEDLAVMPVCKIGTQWHLDRIQEMQWINRQLVRLGAIPADAVVE